MGVFYLGLPVFKYRHYLIVNKRESHNEQRRMRNGPSTSSEFLFRDTEFFND